MPKYSRKNFKKGGNRKKRYQSKLADKKINTLVEKRMEQIAKKEAKKARAKTYKDFELGAYSNSGQVASLVNVTDSSDATLLNIFELPVHDEDATKSTVSQRLGDFAYIRGFKVAGVLRMAGTSSDMMNLRVKCVLFSQRRQIDPLANQILTDLPTPCIYNDLNGSPKDEDQIDDYSKLNIIKTYTCDVKPHRAVAVNKHFEFSHYFKNPIKQQWEPVDVGGTNPMKHAYFLTIFSDRNSASTGLQSPLQVCLNARTYYYTE